MINKVEDVVYWEPTFQIAVRPNYEVLRNEVLVMNVDDRERAHRRRWTTAKAREIAAALIAAADKADARSAEWAAARERGE